MFSVYFHVVWPLGPLENNSARDASELKFKFQKNSCESDPLPALCSNFHSLHMDQRPTNSFKVRKLRKFKFIHEIRMWNGIDHNHRSSCFHCRHYFSGLLTLCEQRSLMWHVGVIMSSVVHTRKVIT